jgi:hypothetical protein
MAEPSARRSLAWSRLVTPGAPATVLGQQRELLAISTISAAP